MTARYHKYRQPRINAWKFNLLELILLTSCAASAFAMAGQGLGVLGFFFLLTVVAFRTAVFDFSVIGSLATLLTMVFGTVSIAILVLWSAGF